MSFLHSRDNSNSPLVGNELSKEVPFSTVSISAIPCIVRLIYRYTVKLDFKELLNKEQIDFKELFTDYQLFYTINLLLSKELLPI